MPEHYQQMIESWRSKGPQLTTNEIYENISMNSVLNEEDLNGLQETL